MVGNVLSVMQYLMDTLESVIIVPVYKEYSVEEKLWYYLNVQEKGNLYYWKAYTRKD